MTELEALCGMSDLEAMYHRFSRKNIKTSTGLIAKVLGVPTKVYEDAVRRGLEQEYNLERNKKKMFEVWFISGRTLKFKKITVDADDKDSAVSKAFNIEGSNFENELLYVKEV